jgi:hypothetical protein
MWWNWHHHDLNMENDAGIGQIILALIPFALMVGGYVAYLYLRSLRTAISTDLKAISARLRNFSRQLKLIGDYAALFQPDDPEPYGSVVEETNSRIIQNEQHLHYSYQVYTKLQTEYNALQKLSWNNFWQIPALWSRINKELHQFNTSLDSIESQFKTINELIKIIENLGWEVANQSRQNLEKVRSSFQEANDLQVQGLGDEQLEKVQVKLKEWESTLLKQIPVIFFTADQLVFNQSADKNLVSKVHKIVGTCQKDIDRINNILNEWKTDTHRAAGLLHSVEQQFKAIDQLTTKLEHAPNNPVYCDLSRPALDDISLVIQQLNQQKITVSKSNRVVKQLEQTVTSLNQLQKNIEALLQMHLEIAQITNTTEFARSLEWSKGALATLEENREYHSDNWKGVSKLDDLHTHLRDFLAKQAKIMPRQISGTLVESKIESLLQSLRYIKAQYDRVKLEFDAYFAQLKVITGHEKRSKESLSADYAPLKQAQSVIESNPFLKKLAGAEVGRMILAVEQLNFELDQKGKGTVQSKAKKIDELHHKLEFALKKWLEKLTEDIDKKKDDLSKTINVLQDLVSLNDPVFIDVVQLVQDQRQDAFKTIGTGQTPVLNLFHQIRAQSELWQRIVAASKAIEDIAGPVLDRHQKMEKNRQNLIARMERADETVPEVLSWPPTTIRLTNERSKFQTLEKQYAAFKQERHKAIQLVAQLSELSDNYQDLFTQVGLLLDQASQEQGRFMELEHRLRQSQSMWNQRLSDNRSTPSTVIEIERLQKIIENDFDELQRRHKSGNLPYQQTYQMLRLICRKIDEATVSLGANQIIDINGVTHRQI